MPELPEVETVRSALEKTFSNAVVSQIALSGKKMRWDIPRNLKKVLKAARLKKYRRRGKYILIDIDKDDTHWVMLLHLGMSGSVRIYPDGKSQHEKDKHDHLILDTQAGKRIVLNDPRRFGGVDLFRSDNEVTHPLLFRMGVEPLGNMLNGALLKQSFKGKKAVVKSALLDQRIVAGVGNIYACEILYEAGISPLCQAGRVSLKRCEALACAIRAVLERAIEAGGTSLRDHRQPSGEIGYFAQELKVYGREGGKCYACGKSVSMIRQSGRATYYCKHCQS